MGDPKHVTIVKKGRAAWNRWRLLNADTRPDLSGANLIDQETWISDKWRLVWKVVNGTWWSTSGLAGADLSNANLIGADLSEIDLTNADLTGANLRRATLSKAYLTGADLTEAAVEGAVLKGAGLHDSLGALFNSLGSGLKRLRPRIPRRRRADAEGEGPECAAGREAEAVGV